MTMLENKENIPENGMDTDENRCDSRNHSKRFSTLKSRDSLPNDQDTHRNGPIESQSNDDESVLSNSKKAEAPERKLTAFERLSNDLSQDKRVLKEITLGRRISFYRIRGELGSGNFSQVRMGIHALTHEKVAIKILDKTKLDQKTQRLLSREISSMERLHHPNVIRLYEVVETLAKLHIIMEYAGGGELFTKISNEGRLPEADAKPFFAQVVAAVTHMHDNHIIHRDLKAENVFFATPYIVKVGDFGFSTFSRVENTLNTFCGSPPYAAPELFKDESYVGIYVDIWALGILLFFMVSGIMPFRAETVAKLKKCILDGTYNMPSYLTNSCQKLIRNILQPLPADRVSMDQIRSSDWLDGEEFPEAMPAFHGSPERRTSSVGGGAGDSSLSAEEREARETLERLGITEQHLRDATNKDSRSIVMGTYRIVLHKIQKRSSKEAEYWEQDVYRQGTYSSKRSPNHKASSPKKSKTCTIL